jgi:hypothetical protein
VIRRALSGLAIAITAAGCSPSGAGDDARANAVAGNAVAPAPTASATWDGPKLAGGSWAGVFTTPATAIDLFGRIGLRPGAYRQAGTTWESRAVPTPLTDPSARDVVVADFVASGTRARIDTLAFTLHEPAASNDQQARDQFEQWIAQALAQLGVTGGDTVTKAIHGQKPLSGQLKGGADYRVTRTTTPKERLTAVTFTRSASISGQTNQGSM